MAESLMSMLSHARARTAGPGRSWHRATITDLTPLATHDLDVPSLSMTVTAQDGSALVWELSDQAVGDEFAVGETIWIRQRDAQSEDVPADSPRWDTTGQWVLEPPASRQRRQTLVHRWGRGLATGIVALDALMGRWRLLLELGVLIALALFIEPAWVIVVAGLLLIACHEVALQAV